LCSPSFGDLRSKAGRLPSKESGIPISDSAPSGDVLDHPQRRRLRMLRHLIQRLQGRAGNPVRLQTRQPVRRRLADKDLFQQRDQLAAIDDAVLVGAEARILRELGLSTVLARRRNRLSFPAATMMWPSVTGNAW